MARTQYKRLCLAALKQVGEIAPPFPLLITHHSLILYSTNPSITTSLSISPHKFTPSVSTGYTYYGISARGYRRNMPHHCLRGAMVPCSFSLRCWRVSQTCTLCCDMLPPLSRMWPFHRSLCSPRCFHLLLRTLVPCFFRVPLAPFFFRVPGASPTCLFAQFSPAPCLPCTCSLAIAIIWQLILSCPTHWA